MPVLAMRGQNAVQLAEPTTGLNIPFAYIKTATGAQERNKYFGWNHYHAVSIR